MSTSVNPTANDAFQTGTQATATPSAALEAVLVQSTPMPEGAVEVRGYDFNNGVNYSELFNSYLRTGFQATSIGQAAEEINRMVRQGFRRLLCGKAQEPCALMTNT